MNDSTPSIDIYHCPMRAIGGDSALPLAYMIAVMQAAADGKPLQAWNGFEWKAVSVPRWNWLESCYRIDPAARPKPFDCPFKTGDLVVYLDSFLVGEVRRVTDWFTTGGNTFALKLDGLLDTVPASRCRLAPIVRKIPLTGSDLTAPVLWYRRTSNSPHALITYVDVDEIAANAVHMRLTGLSECAAQWSTNRQDWRPFWKEVEA